MEYNRMHTKKSDEYSVCTLKWKYLTVFLRRSVYPIERDVSLQKWMYLTDINQQYCFLVAAFVGSLIYARTAFMRDGLVSCWMSPVQETSSHPYFRLKHGLCCARVIREHSSLPYCRVVVFFAATMLMSNFYLPKKARVEGTTARYTTTTG